MAWRSTAAGNLFDGGRVPRPMEEVAEAGGNAGSAAALPQTAAGSLFYGAAALKQTATGSLLDRGRPS